MTIGVPKEVKDHEARVGLLPSGVTALTEAGHKVLAQASAGVGSSLPDEEYANAGAQIRAHRGRGLGEEPTWWSRSRSRSRPNTDSCARG